MGERYGFRTSFRGFSREDVLAYIDELRLTLHREQEERRSETEALREQLAQAETQVAGAPSQAADHEEALRAELEASQETVIALREQTAALTEELRAAQAAASAEREKELADALAEARAEVQALRERENELNAQLAETHQAVAQLWQEKEAADRKLSLALEFADRQQAAALEFKQQFGGETPSREETSSHKPMERWLF